MWFWYLLILMLCLPSVALCHREATSVVKSRTCVGKCIHVSKFSTTEWRVIAPVLSAPDQQVVAEWRLNKPAGHTIWEISELFGRDQRVPASDVTLSAAGGSVYEYAWVVGITDAAQIGFDFYGNAHGAETLLTVTFVLDGIDISDFSVGSAQDGQSLIVTQTKNILLPKNADGSTNLSTVIGSGTLVHTLDTTGVLVTHTHTFQAGYQGYTCYAAMLPNNFANFDRVAVNGGAAYTHVGDDSVQFTTTQITDVAVWNNAATHRYQLNMTLPSGGPAVPSDWTNAGPDYGYFTDSPIRGKTYVLYVNDTYASRKALSTLGVAGTITQQQKYWVSWR